MATRHERGTGRGDAHTPDLGCGLYVIRIKGRLDEHWMDWFEGMSLRHVTDEETGLELTELRGAFADQPALHGALTKIRDLNLTLISVTRPASPGSTSRGSKIRKHRTSPKRHRRTGAHRI